jgi:hypothetical protein
MYVLNDYGVRWESLTNIATEKGYMPNENDVYNPYEPNYGNTNYGRSDKFSMLPWDFMKDNAADMRLFYVFRGKNTWSTCRWDPLDEKWPKFWRISVVTNS